MHSVLIQGELEMNDRGEIKPFQLFFFLCLASAGEQTGLASSFGVLENTSVPCLAYPMA